MRAGTPPGRVQLSECTPAEAAKRAMTPDPSLRACFEIGRHELYPVCEGIAEANGRIVGNLLFETSGGEDTAVEASASSATSICKEGGGAFLAPNPRPPT